jgi:hypothetical protein
MQGITPYINFKGNCQEAIDFYKEKLGAEVLFIGRYGDSVPPLPSVIVPRLVVVDVGGVVEVVGGSVVVVVVLDEVVVGSVVLVEVVEVVELVDDVVVEVVVVDE